MKIRSFTRFWAIIAFTGFLVAIILVAWFVSLQATEQEVLDSYNEQQMLLAEGAAVNIETVFSDLRSDLVELLQLPEVQYFDETAARLAFAAEYNNLLPEGLSELGFLDREGVALIFNTRPELENIDYSWRRYFRAARSLAPGDEALVVELDTSGSESVLLFAIPVFETLANEEFPNPSGDFSGVLVASLSVDSIAGRFLLPFQPPAGGQIFLVHDDLEIIWSSNANMISQNILRYSDDAVYGMGEIMGNWRLTDSDPAHYVHQIPGRRNSTELVAFAPVRLGNELLAIGIRTPGFVVRQTSLATFQNQQVVLIASVLVLVVGVIIGGVVLNIETRRRFQAEEALLKSEREQAVLQERNRLAGDLHDSVTQSLYGIVLHANAAKANLDAGKREVAENYLSDIAEAGKEGLAEMRMLIFELRPPVLEEEGLEAALETRLYTVERRVGLHADLDWRIEGRLPEEIEEGFYRIAREAMNNVLKHAGASHLTLRFMKEKDVIKMEIEDNGSGYDVAEGENAGGLGIEGMKARARRFGGMLEIISAPGKGTRVIVEVKE